MRSKPAGDPITVKLQRATHHRADHAHAIAVTLAEVVCVMAILAVLAALYGPALFRTVERVIGALAGY